MDLSTRKLFLPHMVKILSNVYILTLRLAFTRGSWGEYWNRWVEKRYHAYRKIATLVQVRVGNEFSYGGFVVLTCRFYLFFKYNQLKPYRKQENSEKVLKYFIFYKNNVKNKNLPNHLETKVIKNMHDT